MDAIPSFVPKMTCTGTVTATTYKLAPTDETRRANGWGWALATINDATGELSIQSDWGSWSYRWHAAGMPERNGRRVTLTEFIGEREGHHYLADKLAGRERDEFDPHETVASFRKMLCKARLEQGRTAIANARDYAERDDDRRVTDDDVDKAICKWGDKKLYDRYHTEEPLMAGIAREIWEELAALCDLRSGDMFIDYFFRVSGHRWICEEPWNHLENSPTTGYSVLLHGILPALVTACAARPA